MKEIIIDWASHGYVINIKDNGKYVVFDYGNEFEDLVGAVLEYIGDVPFGPKNLQRYSLKIEDEAKRRLGAVKSNV